MKSKLFNLALNRACKSFFDRLGSGALCTKDGSPVYIGYQSLSDIGTLPMACEITNKYLSLKPGQVAILNDPYAGGSTLSHFTLICAVQPFLLAYRFQLRPHLNVGGTIEEEGVRIPPTLIGDRWQLSTDIVSAISQHPLCPSEFSQRLPEEFNKFAKAITDLERILKIFDLQLSSKNIKDYFEESQQRFQNLLAEIPLGDAQVRFSLDRKEEICLRIHSGGKSVAFDFSGSGASERLFLPSRATFGACFGALAALLNNQIPINAGTLRCIDVHTPSSTWMAAEYPKPAYLGMTDGISFVASAAMKALGQLRPAYASATPGVAACPLQIEFKNQTHFFDTLVGGAAATAADPGTDGVNLWIRSPLQPSVEEIEKRFPLRIDRISLRMSSGGRGLKAGGNGVTKTYTLLDDATVRWHLEQTEHKPDGLKGGTSGSEAAIYVSRAGEKKERLLSSGERAIGSGDALSVMSPGGGGYGPESKEEDH